MDVHGGLASWLCSRHNIVWHPDPDDHPSHGRKLRFPGLAWDLVGVRGHPGLVRDQRVWSTELAILANSCVCNRDDGIFCLHGPSVDQRAESLSHSSLDWVLEYWRVVEYDPCYLGRATIRHQHADWCGHGMFETRSCQVFINHELTKLRRLHTWQKKSKTPLLLSLAQ
jgi:hypothetical protein